MQSADGARGVLRKDSPAAPLRGALPLRCGIRVASIMKKPSSPCGLEGSIRLSPAVSYGGRGQFRTADICFVSLAAALRQTHQVRSPTATHGQPGRAHLSAPQVTATGHTIWHATGTGRCRLREHLGSNRELFFVGPREGTIGFEVGISPVDRVDAILRVRREEHAHKPRGSTQLLERLV